MGHHRHHQQPDPESTGADDAGDSEFQLALEESRRAGLESSRRKGQGPEQGAGESDAEEEAELAWAIKESEAQAQKEQAGSAGGLDSADDEELAAALRASRLESERLEGESQGNVWRHDDSGAHAPASQRQGKPSGPEYPPKVPSNPYPPPGSPYPPPTQGYPPNFSEPARSPGQGYPQYPQYPYPPPGPPHSPSTQGYPPNFSEPPRSPGQGYPQYPPPSSQAPSQGQPPHGQPGNYYSPPLGGYGGYGYPVPPPQAPYGNYPYPYPPPPGGAYPQWPPYGYPPPAGYPGYPQDLKPFGNDTTTEPLVSETSIRRQSVIHHGVKLEDPGFAEDAHAVSSPSPAPSSQTRPSGSLHHHRPGGSLHNHHHKPEGMLTAAELMEAQEGAPSSSNVAGDLPPQRIDAAAQSGTLKPPEIYKPNLSYAATIARKESVLRPHGSLESASSSAPQKTAAEAETEGKMFDQAAQHVQEEEQKPEWHEPVDEGKAEAAHELAYGSNNDDDDEGEAPQLDASSMGSAAALQAIQLLTGGGQGVDGDSSGGGKAGMKGKIAGLMGMLTGGGGGGNPLAGFLGGKFGGAPPAVDEDDDEGPAASLGPTKPTGGPASSPGAPSAGNPPRPSGTSGQSTGPGAPNTADDEDEDEPQDPMAMMMGGGAGAGAGGWEEKLIGLAMSEAAKLVDKKGGPEALAAKQEAINSAASTITKLVKGYKTSSAAMGESGLSGTQAVQGNLMGAVAHSGMGAGEAQQLMGQMMHIFSKTS